MTEGCDRLDWLDLSPAETRLYQRALALGRAFTASELAGTETGPDVRRSLLDKGFLSGDADGELVAVAPAAALHGMLQRRLAVVYDEAARLRRAESEVPRLAAELLTSTDGDIPVQAVEVITGRTAIGQRARALVDSCQRELLMLDAPPYAQAHPPAVAGSPGLRAAQARGVKIRRVFDRSALDFPGRGAAIAALTVGGMSARIAVEIPTKLLIADGRTALLPPTPDADARERALLIRDGVLGNVLVPLFELIWRTAVPLGAAPDAPAPADRELLSLLAGGVKDEAIARQLGVHVHTVRRRIARLSEQLGAATRFQAGVQAARRGWLVD
ncbi:hypothetical protein LX16_3145 [Stackebrandtia albiflava]|uniref:HTH luxR-type domain-containing protein n=1 Tax=Stackebrandtia albiflava TaxID=406432 RepID=A0A562V3H5_9ACTN|nr:LuxR family transcriptional regulator [Stackebrandtia albiflava]TWJ12388.1 hypothetical protein LX16_3145 [Stackebrandtia albiflava]